MNAEDLLNHLLLLNEYDIELSEIKINMEFESRDVKVFERKFISNFAFDKKSKTITFY